jgi:hypothetical protein
MRCWRIQIEMKRGVRSLGSMMGISRALTRYAGGCGRCFRIRARRLERYGQQAMPRIAEDLLRVPDHLNSGPDLPADEGVRARLFGEQ